MRPVRRLPLELAGVAALLAAVVGCTVENVPPTTLRRDPAAAEPTRAGPESASAQDAGLFDAAGMAADPPTPAGSATPTPQAPVEVPIADIQLTEVANGWGPLEKNLSNGEIEPNDGKPLTLDGVVYPKGLGVHAASEIVVALAGQYQTFLADVGVDDEVGDLGSIVFQVIVDGETLFDSGVMTGATAAKKVSVDLKGKQQLKLVVTDAGDGPAADHGDWAGARLVK